MDLEKIRKVIRAIPQIEPEEGNDMADAFAQGWNQGMVKALNELERASKEESEPLVASIVSFTVDECNILGGK